MNFLKFNQSLIVAIILGFTLSGCLKEKVSKNTDDPSNHKLKDFYRTVKVPSSSNPENYLKLKISSVDSAYTQRLADYYSDFEVDFIDVDPGNIGNASRPSLESNSVFIDSLSYSVDLDWSNYSFNNTNNAKKKLQQLTFKKSGNDKSFYWVNRFDHVNSVSSSYPFAYARVYNTTSYWYFGTKTSSNWHFSWDRLGQNDFYTKTLYSNMDVAAVATVNCSYNDNHVRLLDPSNSGNNPIGCSPLNPSIVYRNAIDEVPESLRSNKFKSVRGYVDPYNFNLDHHAKAIIYLYRWS